MSSNRPRLDASRAPGAIQVEHCDVPVDMTLGEWRLHCAAERRAAAGPGTGGTMRRGLRRLFGG
ncbi:MAG TPA: hypothetical protein VGW10_07585 [Solirubrobacteraceae bacterium]|nr:hypothetical protein [Solirubrobacteraceae bacterium]